jgi:glycerol transport system ATP-binding protein
VDVTDAPTDRRHIAQVFQFPVVYDTMTVRDNLAFPLQNRQRPKAEIEARVAEIARMLDLESTLSRRASGLTADGKQKISLGRGLVRDDVNVIMFDEPLTVIDPHLKLELRSKLKEMHQRTARTMIYVTHDQTEALTFAQKVVVMHRGKVVQIGSPGMNVLPCRVDGGRVLLGETPVLVQNPPGPNTALVGKRLEIGVRPEFVSLASEGIPVRVAKISDAGRYQIVETRHGEGRIHLLAGEGAAVPGENQGAYVRFDPARTRLYTDGWLVE